LETYRKRKATYSLLSASTPTAIADIDFNNPSAIADMIRNQKRALKEDLEMKSEPVPSVDISPSNSEDENKAIMFQVL
jgi:hypothetical protein